MMKRAIHGNYLRGLGPPIINNQQIFNMHYADDTIFFSQADVPQQWILVEFEAQV